MAKFFSHIFANTGDKTAIPDIADPSGYVSYEVGYPSGYSTVGGKNPERTKLNQILNDITGAIQYIQTEGYMSYQSGYAYDIGATVKFTDHINYVNTVAVNTNAPNVSGWYKALDSSFVHSATSKTTPVNADELSLWDSVTSSLQKLTWANLIATVNTYIATIYAPKASPIFTGTPSLPTGTTVVTQTAGNNSTAPASTAYVDGKMVLRTSVATTSGTSIDFTGIPTWVKRITVILNSVSTNGTSPIILQMGNGSVQTSSYASASSSGTAGAYPTNGLGITSGGTASNTVNGAYIITLGNATTFSYSSFGNMTQNLSANVPMVCAGSVILSGLTDRIRMTTVNGTDTFDAGTVNIMYEG